MKKRLRYYNDLTQGEAILLRLTGKINRVIDFLVPKYAGETALAHALLKLTVHTVHKQVLLRLRRDQLIEPFKGSYRVTKLGRNFVGNLLNKIKDDQNKSWDHLWRVIIFDIPETRKKRTRRFALFNV